MPGPLGYASPGDTIAQERLQPPHKGQTYMGEHNMLSALSKMYADNTNFLKNCLVDMRILSLIIP